MLRRRRPLPQQMRASHDLGGRALRGTLVAVVRSTLKQVGRDELIKGLYLGRLADGSLLLGCLGEHHVSTVSGDGRVSTARWLERRLARSLRRRLILLLGTQH